MAQSTAPNLLTIPPEIRDRIYEFILSPDPNRLHYSDEFTAYDFRRAFNVFRLNRQIYHEARRVFSDLNLFVRIETPWPQATDHVAEEGAVPVLMKNERAAAFKQYSLNVKLDAPFSPIQDAEPQLFVILVDDLAKFTKTWFYADLTHQGLNHYLRLRLWLNDPHSPEWEGKRMQKRKQRRLLMPFGMIKNLVNVDVDGDPKPFESVVAEMMAEQKQPPKRAEDCLDEAQRWKLAGNEELLKGRVESALDLYRRSWEEMHIVIRGRRRYIHADEYFNRTMEYGSFKGKNGGAERLVLRVHLVANTILAHLKRKGWDDARFWGMRSINMLRAGMGGDVGFDGHDIAPEDEVILGFPAAEQIGKIYFRTAMAFKELGDKAQARKLLRVAALYLPNDRIVKEETAACALRIG